jgi:hypothetical protein
VALMDRGMEKVDMGVAGIELDGREKLPLPP